MRLGHHKRPAIISGRHDENVATYVPGCSHQQTAEWSLIREWEWSWSEGQAITTTRHSTFDIRMCHLSRSMLTAWCIMAAEIEFWWNDLLYPYGLWVNWQQVPNVHLSMMMIMRWVSRAAYFTHDEVSPKKRAKIRCKSPTWFLPFFGETSSWVK